MKQFIIENIATIITFVTILVTYILGLIAKKSKKISNNLIPIQNIVIGIIVAIIYYIATGDINAVIASSSAIATVVYDAIHGIEKLVKKEEKSE